MKRSFLSVYPAVFFIVFLSYNPVSAQSWTFVKEKDGISLYTSHRENNSFKSFHGEVEFMGDFEKVCSMIGDPSNLDWWPDDVKNIQVLNYVKDEQIRYYFEYQIPWPFSNRDLVTNVQIDEDPLTGTKTIFSTPFPGLVDCKPGLVRVTDYYQKWTLQPLDSGMIHITLEGYIDPAGDVPAWLYNIVVVDIPLKLLREVRNQAIERTGDHSSTIINN
jgi:hypothetical protein